MSTKITLNVCGMASNDDVNKVRRAISSNEGVLACQIVSSKKQVEIIYDNLLSTEDDIIESIENAGYIVI